jgi:hypothetical protein
LDNRKELIDSFKKSSHRYYLHSLRNLESESEKNILSQAIVYNKLLKTIFIFKNTNHNIEPDIQKFVNNMISIEPDIFKELLNQIFNNIDSFKSSKSIYKLFETRFHWLNQKLNDAPKIGWAMEGFFLKYQF